MTIFMNLAFTNGCGFEHLPSSIRRESQARSRRPGPSCNLHAGPGVVYSMKALAAQMQAKVTTPITRVDEENTRSDCCISMLENLVTTQK